MLVGLVIFAVPHFVGADWITTFTSVAISAVAALGFGILYGRVGMISLGQVALLTLGCWIGTRLSYATSVVLIPDASAKARENGDAVVAALGLPASAVRLSSQGQSLADVVVILGADFRG